MLLRNICQKCVTTKLTLRGLPQELTFKLRLPYDNVLVLLKISEKNLFQNPQLSEKGIFGGIESNSAMILSCCFLKRKVLFICPGKKTTCTVGGQQPFSLGYSCEFYSFAFSWLVRVPDDELGGVYFQEALGETFLRTSSERLPHYRTTREEETNRHKQIEEMYCRSQNRIIVTVSVFVTSCPFPIPLISFQS